MLYEPGTHIDLRSPKPQEAPAERLNEYMPGTRILFVKFIEDLKMLQINSKTFVVNTAV